MGLINKTTSRIPLNISIIIFSVLIISWGNGEGDNEMNFHKQEILNTINSQSSFETKKSIFSDTLIVSSPTVIILVPSKQEIDSLITLWGEDRLYEIAYDENRKLSRIYGALDEADISYHASDKTTIHIDNLNKTLTKNNFPYPWGVLDIKRDGSFLYKTPIEFWLGLKSKTESKE